MLSSDDQELEMLIHLALKQNGLGIPTTIEQVKDEEESESEETAQLPAILKDSRELIRKHRRFSLALSKAPEDPTAIKEAFSLRRAARLGKEIPPEIEDKMQKDRENAEKKS